MGEAAGEYPRTNAWGSGLGNRPLALSGSKNRIVQVNYSGLRSRAGGRRCF